MNEEEINKLLAEFFWTGTRKCEPITGGRQTEWIAFDTATYDGEPLAPQTTPLAAIQIWKEERDTLKENL